MPTFKVTLHISDGLTLGHVLMTKGVELIHIVETDAPLQITHEKVEHKIDHTTITLREHFKHPSGKPIKDFVMDFLSKAPMYTGRWKDINQHLTSMGFAKSSLNNALRLLVEHKVIERKKDGIYKLIEKK